MLLLTQSKALCMCLFHCKMGNERLTTLYVDTLYVDTQPHHGLHTANDCLFHLFNTWPWLCHILIFYLLFSDASENNSAFFIYLP